jgi:cysteine desulfurase
MKQIVYFDHAAATPLDPKVFTAMKPFFSVDFYNPSASYLLAQKVKQRLEKARAKVAHWLGCKASEIIFTAGGTEANNLAIKGVMDAFPGSEIITSSIEHESVHEPAALYDHKIAPVLADGTLNVPALVDLITDKTVLISVMYANNEIGTVQPIKTIASQLTLIKKQRQKDGNKLPLYLHTDAAQAANYLDLHVSRLGVDLMTLNGGKIYGPKQSGTLYIKSGVVLKPQILGGGQERGLRSGTENVGSVIGFAKALDVTQTIRKDEAERLSKLQGLFFRLLNDEIEDIIINGSRRRRLPNNVHFSIPGQDNERLLVLLDEQGIYASAGSACSASDDEPSHVLKAIGVLDDLAQASLRFSMGRSTSEADIRKAVSTLSSLVA